MECIDQEEFLAITAQCGAMAYIKQGDDMIVVEPAAAARLADILAAWAHKASPQVTPNAPPPPKP